MAARSIALQEDFSAAVAEEAFLADRQSFWNGFTTFTAGGKAPVDKQ